ncbi:hypothetical protein MNBD_ALPHA09-1033 [hydrothermal vent metagenome]|uniref:Periplasmic heavy metal sensor n=1 Tax=hydrothermal vent metagenome TaxID=652676 RepID=A0A3B0SX63_9ZZZZ
MSQDASAGQTPPPLRPLRTRRWVKVVLVVSVAFNLVVLGAIGGHFLKMGRGDRFMAGGDWAQSLNLIRTLPRERRRMIFDEFQSQREDLRRDRRAISDARSRVGEALRSGQPETYRRAFEDLANAEAKALRRFRILMADVASRLTEKERARLARHLQRMRGRH